MINGPVGLWIADWNSIGFSNADRPQAPQPAVRRLISSSMQGSSIMS